jgi:hypothetical protein
MLRASATILLTVLGLLASGPALSSSGQTSFEAPADSAGRAATPLAEWTLRDATLLPGVRPGPNPAPQAVGRPQAQGERATPARLWMNQAPTVRKRDLLAPDLWPRGAFSVELFVSYHVDQRVGAALLAFEPDADAPLFAFGFEAGDVTARLGSASLTLPAMELKSSIAGQDLSSGAYKRGALRYWHHLVLVNDGRALTIWRNGEKLGETPVRGERLSGSARAELELAGYLANEPFMRLSDLTPYAAVHGRALNEAEIQAAFARHMAPVRAGAPLGGAFHFTTGGPHLAWPMVDSVMLHWETDRPASARLEWGETPTMGRVLELPATGMRVRTATMDGLKPNAAYFYRLTATAPTGETLDTGPIPFRTAPGAGDPIVFAAISDTEARPHVNARLADLVWRESPQILLNAGDLTDGGKGEHRFEWTHEYFAAMAPLMARTAVLPVMGNGEDDFTWFERYHALKAPGRSYYTYRLGDVDFFVLDSNLDRRDREEPGFRAAQRAWLETALAASQGRWKVATFHHPPLPEQYAKVTDDFMPLLERFGVDLILVGHHHNYLRSWPMRGGRPAADRRGPVVIQLGGGGGNISNRSAVPDPRWAKTYQGYGYLMVRAFGDRMELVMHDDQGAVRDHTEITKR